MMILVLLGCLVIGSTSGARLRRMVGATEIPIEQAPYQVSLRFNGMHVCGGALISPSHILTAAHCVADLFDEPYDDLTVVTGTSSLKSGGNVNKVKAVKWHPKFIADPKTFWNHDIAIITLVKPIKQDNKQESVKLPIKDIQNDRTGFVTGFGRTVTANPYPSPNLLSMKTRVLTSEACRPLTVGQKMMDCQICGLQKKGLGVCKGDSGSPLVVDGRLVGVVSWNRPEPCGSGIPDVYTNVYRYLEFIKSATRG